MRVASGASDDRVRGRELWSRQHDKLLEFEDFWYINAVKLELSLTVGWVCQLLE